MNNELFKIFIVILKKNIFISNNDLLIELSPLELKKSLFILRDLENTMYKMLIDIVAVDYPDKVNRFLVIYNLLSLKYNSRIKIKVFLNDLYSLPSIVDIYKSACWMEREVWDMNGVFIKDHPDFRRILTDYGFEGHPFKKDFPLSGYIEVRYDDSQKRVVFESVEMTQEYRLFSFKNYWI